MAAKRRFELEGHDVAGIRADNPGPLTLEGTNSWVVGRDPAWVIDPGPLISEHIALVAAEVQSRGGLGGVALTHSHADHSDGVALLLELAGEATVVGLPPHGNGVPSHGDVHGPLEAHALPGHSADHTAWVAGGVAFTGDAIFAESSVFVSPGRGSLSGYLDSLEALAARKPLLLAPGHGPVIADPQQRIHQQVAHRLDRERRLVESLAAGRRTVDELLAEVWDDVAPGLLPAAEVTLAAHLDRLDEEGRLPADVERPRVSGWIV